MHRIQKSNRCREKKHLQVFVFTLAQFKTYAQSQRNYLILFCFFMRPIVVNFKTFKIHLTRCIASKRVTSLWDLNLRLCACGKPNSFRRVIRLNLIGPRFEPRPVTYPF